VVVHPPRSGGASPVTASLKTNRWSGHCPRGGGVAPPSDAHTKGGARLQWLYYHSGAIYMTPTGLLEVVGAEGR